MGYVSMRTKINSLFSFASRNFGSVSISRSLRTLVFSKGTKDICVRFWVVTGVIFRHLLVLKELGDEHMVIEIPHKSAYLHANFVRTRQRTRMSPDLPRAGSYDVTSVLKKERVHSQPCSPATVSYIFQAQCSSLSTQRQKSRRNHC